MKIVDIMDRSTGNIDGDYVSKGRKPTTPMVKPYFFAVPEMPWVKKDSSNEDVADTQDTDEVTE